MLNFSDPDRPEAAVTLRQALNGLGNVPVIGLLIKTTKDGDIVNWRFTDAQTAKSLALVLPEDDETKE